MDNQDYLTDYRLFFDNFYQSFEMDNPLPVHIGKYNVAEFEIVGEVICWCLEYLNIRKCPSSLIAPLCRSVIVELEDVVRRDPESCGYRSKEDDYQTLKLMQVTIKKLNEVCLRYRENSEVGRLPPPPPVSPSVSVAAVKNSRRTMEDCHIVIHDLHALFGIEGYGVASYYAVFDGHIGSDAALYSCSHIYQYLVESQYYPTNPEAAFKEAFIKTDERFIDKSNKENLKSGTTAVCILLRHDLGKMYVAWLGDSQAILVNGRDYIQLVNPHRPEQIEEKERIEAMGGSVVFWGTWRVNGQLAVSRAIGDVDYKPYVTAEPDVTSYDLTGDEDFLLLACDGLWDVVSEKHAVEEVYKCLELHKGDRSKVSQSLVQAAKSLGSKDNISVVVAWLDMSTLENGHFVPGAEVDAVDDMLLPPVLRSLKPAAHTIAPPAAQRLDEKSEKWLKTLPWSYADALRKPAPKKEAPPPRSPGRQPSPVPPQSGGESGLQADGPEEQPAEPQQLLHPTPKGGDSGDVGGEGESGDDSDEEWNYISGKENREPNQHTKQELTPEEMESQLNPNAAEFVPGYGTRSPTSDLDIVDISQSPKQSDIKSLENVVVPTSKEFLKEICKRPSDLDDLGENETTLNGGDLNNLSTKALFGDDSVCLNSVNDSSLVQNESLKSTNPFASSQVPNFVQDHFSVPDVDFKPFTDSKDNEDFGLMGNSEKPDLSPSAPALDVYSNEQTDLAGLTFGDGLNVGDLVRSKQDSPLLQESPEPGLHNGQADHDANSLEKEKCTTIKESGKSRDEELPKDDESISLPPRSPFTSDFHEGIDKQVIADITTEALMHSDHGPETSVDSESDEDVLLSPKMKEKKIDASGELEAKTGPVEDSVCSLNESHDIDGSKKTSLLGKELEEEHVLFKDDEDGEEELICSIKHRPSESSYNFVSEVAVKDSKLFENISPMVSPDVPSDFEIVNENGDNFASDLQKGSDVCVSKEVKDVVSDDLSSHPQPVENILEEEIHEELIFPVKETQSLQEALKDTEKSVKSSFEKIAMELSDSPQAEIVSHESVSEFQNVLEKHKDYVGEEEIICMSREESEGSTKNSGEVEEALICPLKKDDLVCFTNVGVSEDNEQDVTVAFGEQELICPINKDDNINDGFKNNIQFLSSVTKEDLDIYNTRQEEKFVCPAKKEDELVLPVQKDDELIFPIQNKDELVCAIEKDDNSVCAIQKEDSSVCAIQKDDNSVCAVQKEEELVCSFQKEDELINYFNNKPELVSCPDEKENELACPIQKEDILISPAQIEDQLISPIPKENELVSSIQKVDDLVSPIQKEVDLGCSIRKEDDLVCSIRKEDDLVCPIQKDDSVFSIRKEDDLVCSIRKEDDLVCSIRKEDDLVCPIRKEDNSVCAIQKEDELLRSINKDDLVCPIKTESLICPVKKAEYTVGSDEKENDLAGRIMNEEDIVNLSNKIEDSSPAGNSPGSFNLLQKDEENVFTLENQVVVQEVCGNKNDEIHEVEELICPVKSHEESVSSQITEKVSFEPEEFISSSKEEVICSMRPSADSNAVISNAKIETEIQIESAPEVSHKFSEEIQENLGIASEILVKTATTGEVLTDDNLISSEKITEESVDNLESSSDKLHQEESIDEMSSSMIDHGEDKSLPEAQSNHLDLVQDLQFEVHEKTEADTESDSGFEIINASEASTIEMEVRFQSEKEAVAIDEKLHLDKNEGEIVEKVEAAVSGQLESEPEAEEAKRKSLEPLDTKKALDEVVGNGAIETPATPPATPAPGLQVDSKEGLIAAAVAAAGVATAIAAGTAAVAVTESKLEEKKKPPTPKKAEPLSKTAPTAKPPTSKATGSKPAPPTKAATTAKAATLSLKSTAKPSSGPTKTAPTTAKPTSASKPSTPTTKMAAKPGSKPSTPTGPKPAPSTAPKSKLTTSAPLKSTTAPSVGSKPGAAKPALGVAKKPAPTAAPKPATTVTKSAASSSIAARAAAKPVSDAKSTVSSTQKSPATKMSPTKPTTPTATKAPASTRLPATKSASLTKPPTSTAPAKPAPIKAPAAKAPAAKTASAPKPLSARPAAPAKTAPAKAAPVPLNKKPAAPTAIKKPTAPTDKSVKEANNKLASAKIGVKKIDDKNILNKKEEIGENEVPLTQEPVVTTTNGHISLIENGMPSSEIVADAN